MACMVRAPCSQHAVVDMLQFLHQQVYHVSVSGRLDLCMSHASCNHTAAIHLTCMHMPLILGGFPAFLSHMQCNVLQLVLDVVDFVVGLQRLPEQSTCALFIGVCANRALPNASPTHCPEHRL